LALSTKQWVEATGLISGILPTWHYVCEPFVDQSFGVSVANKMLFRGAHLCVPLFTSNEKAAYIEELLFPAIILLIMKLYIAIVLGAIICILLYINHDMMVVLLKDKNTLALTSINEAGMCYFI